MARYFYDYSLGATITSDDVGTICRDDAAAVKHAWAALPNMLVDIKAILPWQHVELIVRREDGVHVGRLGMTVTVETRNPAATSALGLRDGGEGGGGFDRADTTRRGTRDGKST